MSAGTLNGNKLVNTEHVFIHGDGCYFRDIETAKSQGLSLGGSGYWQKSIIFDGAEWFMAGNTNTWD
jgi:cytoskeletal protein CcmA (bactofilin family)